MKLPHTRSSSQQAGLLSYPKFLSFLTILLVLTWMAAACGSPTSSDQPSLSSAQENTRPGNFQIEISSSADREGASSASSQIEVSSSPDQEGGSSASSPTRFSLGICQFAPHPSLDNCRKGFLQGLAAEGFVEGTNLRIDYQNAQADMALASQIAENFVGKKYDMIMAIATPAAMYAYNATRDTDIPLVYTAISDPLAAGLADQEGRATGNLTGTSDELPVEAQLQMIREILPQAQKLGILYTLTEANSEASLARYQELVGDYDFELVSLGISNSADIPLALDKLLLEVDCLTNLTDNTVVNSLPLILDKAFHKNIPVFGSEIEQVALGCLAAEGLDYLALGEQTGRMAARILRGEVKAADLPYESFADSALYLNLQAEDQLGLELSQACQERAKQVFKSLP